MRPTRRITLAGALLLGACYSGLPESEGGQPTDGAESEGQDDGDDTVVPEEGEVVSGTAVRRLSRREVDNVLVDLFGISGAGTTHLPLDTFTPFDTDASTKLPSAVFVDGHEAMAEQVAIAFAANPASVAEVAGCTPSGSADTECMRALVERLGRRLWRRPLTEAEVTPLLASALEFASEQNDFQIGAQLVAQSLLLSPEFIYLAQVGEARDAGHRELTPHELVARLSFLILGTAPDAALLDRADEGEIDDEELLALAETLLEERADRAGDQLVGFHTMWFGIQEPRVPDAYIADASIETDALLRRVMIEDQDPWSQIFLASSTYVSTSIAEFYGLPAPAGDQGWVEYPDPTQQSGVLSHMSWASQGALSLDETSPTKRGIRVVKGLLCRGVPPPPPDVNVDNVEIPDTGCLSDFYAAHAEPGTACHSCHSTFDPVGRGLDRWDAYGRFRETEPGRPECPITGDGELTGVGTFNGPRQLSEMLVDSGELTACLAQRWVEFSAGRGAEPQDADAIERIHTSFIEADQDISALVLAYVADPTFRYRIDPEVCQ